MGGFSFFHWLVLLIVIGIPIAIVWAAVRYRRRKNADESKVK